jgi:peptidoglycan/xylan/chitin deacetylase (PgdA/CDA1 family)
MTSAATFGKKFVKAPLDLAAALMGPHRWHNQSGLWVLMYHRILPQSDARYAIEEPGMIVEPETFRQHIRLLKRFFTIISLSEWVDRQRMGKPLPANACCITFDDGWVDNYEFAMPIIQSEQVPVTLFVVSDMVDTTQQFWPNKINELCQGFNKQALLEQQWFADCVTDFSGEKFSRDERSRIISQLKNYSDEYIHNKLAEFDDESKYIVPKKSLLSWAQLKSMVDSGLVEVGSHTCNHLRLQSTLDESIVRREIVESKARLQDELSTTIDLFCYPNGDTCPAAIELVKSYYKAGVTTERGINGFIDADLHLLKRIGVHQDISNTPIKLQARLSNWF